MTDQLPQGWKKASIAEVIEPKVSKRVPSEEEGVSYIDIASINRKTKTIESPKKLLNEKIPSRARQILNTNDVLVSMTRPNLNAVALVPPSLNQQIASTGFDVLRAKDGVDPRWIYYLVRTEGFVRRMTELVQGALYPAVRPKDVRAYEFPLPPFDQQQRISNRFDLLFSLADSCLSHIENVPALLRNFRDSVLNSAVSGKLTDDWRRSRNLELKWRTVSFGDLIVEGPQNGLYKPKSAYGTGTNIIRIDSFYEGEIESWDTLKRLSIEPEELVRYGLNINDIIVNRVNSPTFVGKSALVRFLPESCVFESNMMRLRVDESKINPEFCIRFLNSPIGLSLLRKNVKHAVNQSSINQRDVRAVEILLPEMDEQAVIVNRTNQLMGFSKVIENHLSNTLFQLERLYPSILNQGFDQRGVSP